MRFEIKTEYTLYLKIKNLSKKKLTKKLAYFFLVLQSNEAKR